MAVSCCDGEKEPSDRLSKLCTKCGWRSEVCFGDLAAAVVVSMSDQVECLVKYDIFCCELVQACSFFWSVDMLRTTWVRAATTTFCSELLSFAIRNVKSSLCHEKIWCEQKPPFDIV